MKFHTWLIQHWNQTPLALDWLSVLGSLRAHVLVLPSDVLMNRGVDQTYFPIISQLILILYTVPSGKLT